MSEYWKSTPSYWCKFCSVYVKDTPVEKRSHEASGRHQGAITKQLRELEKGKAREDRDRQRAKDEVARLNGLIPGKASQSAGTKPTITGLKDLSKSAAAAGPAATTAAQRRAHAEQLVALGVELPEELKREVTGIGGWQTVSQTVVDEEQPRTLAGIVKQEEDSKEGVKVDGVARGVHKRQADQDQEDSQEAAAAFRRRAWGTKRKTYPGSESAEGGTEDLDALLSGVAKKKPPAEVKKEESEVKPEVKREGSAEENSLAIVPDFNASVPTASVKQEGGAPVFKKRKVKK